jgi:hypothetical protein
MCVVASLSAQKKESNIPKAVADMILRWCTEAWVEPDKTEGMAASLVAAAQQEVDAAERALKDADAAAKSADQAVANKVNEMQNLERGQRQAPESELDLEKQRGELQAKLAPLKGFDDRLTGLRTQLQQAQPPVSPTRDQRDYLTTQIEVATNERQAYLAANPDLATVPQEMERIEAAIEASKDGRLGSAASTRIMQLRRDLAQDRQRLSQAESARETAQTRARSLKTQLVIASLVSRSVKACADDGRSDGAGGSSTPSGGGTAAGSYGGSCTDGQSATGSFTMTIAPNGAVTGYITNPGAALSGVWDPKTGAVAGATGLGASSWGGALVRSGNRFTGSGSAKYTPWEGQVCTVRWEAK